jgi:hypothetical protein
MGNDLTFSYREALSMVLDNIILLLVVPHRFLQMRIIPVLLRRVSKAAANYKEHMERMFDEEIVEFKEGKVGANSIMTSFVRALHSCESGIAQGLSKDEVFGDIFAINFCRTRHHRRYIGFQHALARHRPRTARLSV